LEITQQADYAVRTVLELALHPEGACVVSGEVARRQGIPAPFLAKTVALLVAADIVTTQRGVNGGIRLTRPANEITLLAVIEAIDGTITLNRCLRHPSECSRSRACVVHPLWLEICANLRSQLSRIHFASLAEKLNGHAAAFPAELSRAFTPQMESRQSES
jgi:Rrf2 family iron-sulfur cluster assembly transcriptional regulator